MEALLAFIAAAMLGATAVHRTYVRSGARTELEGLASGLRSNLRSAADMEVKLADDGSDFWEKQRDSDNRIHETLRTFIQRESAKDAVLSQIKANAPNLAKALSTAVSTNNSSPTGPATVPGGGVDVDGDGVADVGPAPNSSATLVGGAAGGGMGGGDGGAANLQGVFKYDETTERYVAQSGNFGIGEDDPNWDLRYEISAANAAGNYNLARKLRKQLEAALTTGCNKMCLEKNSFCGAKTFGQCKVCPPGTVPPRPGSGDDDCVPIAKYFGKG